MRRIVVIAAVLSMSIVAMAESPRGIKPRAKAESYPLVNAQTNLTLGVQQLSPKEVRKTFVSSLGKKYIVLEVGAYPKSEVQVAPQDFMLVVHGQKEVIRPTDPETIAAKLAKKETSANNDITVSPVVGVTYNTGGGDPYNPYDPYNQRGLSTTTGVMVSTGGAQRSPKTIEADRKTMATELKDKQLPAESTAKPVAGYLYFPAPEKTNEALELQYQGPAGNAVIPLPPVSD